jgi:hypothetical protein
LDGLKGEGRITSELFELELELEHELELEFELELEVEEELELDSRDLGVLLGTFFLIVFFLSIGLY